MHRYSVEQIGLFLTFLLLWPTLAGAEWEVVDVRQYENCHLQSEINTQAILDGEDNTEGHALNCYGEKVAFAFAFSKGTLGMSVWGRGDQATRGDEGETISVAIRIDDAPTIRREVTVRRGRMPNINEPALASTLLDLIGTGQRAVIGVGEKRGFIPLTAHVHAAVQDFRSRLPRKE